MAGANYYRCKKDANHLMIAEEFIIRGYSILDCSPLKNAIDFVATNGIKTYFVECKKPKGKLSPGEVNFQQNFKGNVYNLECRTDAIRLLDFNLYDCPDRISKQLNKQ